MPVFNAFVLLLTSLVIDNEFQTHKKLTSIC